MEHLKCAVHWVKEKLHKVVEVVKPWLMKVQGLEPKKTSKKKVTRRKKSTK